MNDCGFLSLNVSRCIPQLWAQALGALPWWAPWAGYGALALLALWALSKVKEVAGNGGVIAVLGVVAYLVGYWRGNKGESVIPHEQLPPGHVDAAPPPPMPRRRDRTVFDRLNGK